MLSVVCEPENQLLVITINVFTMQYVHFLNKNCIFTINTNQYVLRVLIPGIVDTIVEGVPDQSQLKAQSRLISRHLIGCQGDCVNGV